MDTITRAALKITEPAIICAAARGLDMSERALERDYGAKTMEIASRLGRPSFKGIAALCLELEGREAPPFHSGPETIQAAMSTESLPAVMSNLANRALLEAYNATGAVADAITSKTNLRNLQVATRVRLTSAGAFERVAPDGRIPFGSLSEEPYDIHAETYGQLLSIDRQMFTNDDVGAFVHLPRIIGRTAAVTKERILFEAILAGIGSFFSAANGNYVTGGGTALQASSLATAAKALREQKDANGNFVLQVPRAVVCPPALEETALTLYRNTTVGAAVMLGDAGTPLSGDVPMGRYTPAVAAYAGTAGGLSGGTDTGWILIGNPADVAAFQIGYVDNQTVPLIRQVSIGEEFLSMGFQAYWDFGVALADHRAAVYSAGA